MRSKLDDGAASQRPGTIQCLPFQGVPIYQTPFKRLYNLPKALGGPGFYEVATPPPTIATALHQGTQHQKQQSRNGSVRLRAVNGQWIVGCHVDQSTAS